MSADTIDADLERATLRAVGRRLSPFLFLLYIVAYLDRVNVGFAALQMNERFGFDPAVYGFGAGIFFIGYALCEVPSNLILARVGARRWIARIMITWGLISASMMFVRGPLSFYTLRFLLGVAEAGFFPGIIYYLGQWFPAEARARAIARFAIAIPLAGVIGGPVSGALLGLDGRLGLDGWQWLFLLEGLPAVVLGLVVLHRLTERPEDADWLGPAQRAWLAARLAAERRSHEERHGLSVLRALTNRVVWQLGLLVLLSVSFGQYALGLWLPQMIRTLGGLSDWQTGLVSAIPSLVAVLAMMIVAAHSDRTGERSTHVAVASVVAAGGFLGCSMAESLPAAVVFLSLATAGLLSSIAPCWSLPSRFLTGAAAAGGIALINSIANLSGFLGPWTIGLMNRVSGDFRTGFMLLAVVPIAGMLLALRLRRAAELGASAPPRTDVPDVAPT